MSDHLLLFNLATDADDPILNFTTVWINRLALHFDTLDVITMRAGRIAVAPNVRVFSVGKERGYSEARRAAAFYRLLRARLTERRYRACFAHMMPLFTVMGWPLLRARRIPITLWYTHRQAGRVLRLAERLSWRVVTAAPDSFPIPSDKVRVIGHGIDTDFFSPADRPPTEQGTIVYVARIMPIKRQDALIRALAALPDARARLVGAVPADSAAARQYRAELERLAVDLEVADRVTFTGPLSPDGVRAELRAASAAVNLSPAGLFDKAALESMACGVPTLVTNPAFDPLLGGAGERLRIPDAADPEPLAARLRDLLALDPAQRAALGAELRARVVAGHSLDALIPRLVGVLRTGEPA
jgi:glycosyltransferase involved in cell wall biosynthesis